MAERQTPDPRRSGERRQTTSRGGERQQTAPLRRTDVIRCENCGEDYSITYKRCPFCDERPGRGGGSGKRVANTRGGGYGRPASSLRIAGWVISFGVILCAVLIIVRFMGAPLFGGGKKPNSGSSSSSNSSTSQSGGQSSGGGSDVSGSQSPQLETIMLSAISISLDNGASTQLTASLRPEGAEGEVTWTSSDLTAAAVDSSGVVTNVYTGAGEAQATITAACGEVTAQCTVTCKGKAVTPPAPPSSTQSGTIVNADTGLNIRSGPGREYDVVASASNGARVTILGEENGWYHVRYNGNLTGYVSKDFVSVG